MDLGFGHLDLGWLLERWGSISGNRGPRFRVLIRIVCGWTWSVERPMEMKWGFGQGYGFNWA